MPDNMEREILISLSLNIFLITCTCAYELVLWNSLPINLRQCRSLEQFKRLLKTFLFSA